MLVDHREEATDLLDCRISYLLDVLRIRKIIPLRRMCCLPLILHSCLKEGEREGEREGGREGGRKIFLEDQKAQKNCSKAETTIFWYNSLVLDSCDSHKYKDFEP